MSKAESQDFTTFEDTHWHALRLFNGYRFVLSIAMLTILFTKNTSFSQESMLEPLFQKTAISFFIFCIASIMMTLRKTLSLTHSVFLQAVGDIFFIIILMHALGGVKSGFGLLLIITLAGIGLLSHGRLSLFFASVASISLLFEQSLQIFANNLTSDEYTHTIILCLGCFATAWLAHILAKRTRQSEDLATQRGVDLENLAQINALITHEMQDGVVVVDANLHIKHYNLQAITLLNIGEHWNEITLLEKAADLSQIIKEWMNKTNENRNLYKLSSESRYLAMRIQPIDPNRTQGAVIFIEDWSQMQTQSHQNKLAALGRLTANIAHEIRNPLSAISHASQLLQEEDIAKNPLTQRMLAIIDDNVARVDHIVKDVLELNRRDRTERQCIQLEAFIAEFHQQFCQVEKITAESFSYQFDSLALAAKINFDYRHLNQILWNLCQNGWRYSQHQQGSLNVAVHTTAKSPSVRIEISDDGNGIPDHVRAHLFEPFFTTESTGTGLGLYISKELAEANGAKIQYKPLTQGSQFTLHLMKA